MSKLSAFTLSSAAALTATTALLVGCSNASSDQIAASPASSPSSLVSAEPSSSPATTPSSAPLAELTTEPAEEATVEASQPAVEESVPPAEPVQPPLTDPTSAAPQVVAVVTPDPVWDAVRITVPQGSSFTINGGGYQPGQSIAINLGIARSDGMVMDEQTVIADAAGDYSFTITIEADLEPRTYAVLTYVIDGGRGGPDFEATKRFAVIDVVPA
jgi:hypothetical protein